MKRIFVVLVLALPGCAFTDGQLRARASTDLRCPAQQLNISMVDADQRELRGCGHDARYAPGSEQWQAVRIDGQPVPDAHPVLGPVEECALTPADYFPHSAYLPLPPR